MKKIKFFLDPINDLETWLNDLSKKGYRLKSIKNFVYEFEKNNQSYSYTTQFIGSNSSSENNGYIQMLKENGTRIYRAPLNQGNFSLGKFRFRPFAHEDGKIANTFQGLNKEILVVENEGREAAKLLTDKADLTNYYKNIRNAYLQGFILILLLFFYSIYKTYEYNFEIYRIVLTGIIGLISFLIAMIIIRANKNYKKYKLESEIAE